MKYCMKCWRYLKYIIRHKWFVFWECYKRNLFWLGFTHDWSKLLPSELISYMNYFYDNVKTDTGDKDFDFAWLLHQKRNRHHWQWWILPEDEGGIKILDMPLKYRLEMLSDWIGAGKAQGNPDSVVIWYEKNKNKMRLHDSTRKWIEKEMEKETEKEIYNE